MNNVKKLSMVKAVAALLNRSFQPKDITTVTVKDSRVRGRSLCIARKRKFAAFVALGLVGVLSTVPISLVEAITNTRRLRDAVTVAGIRKHLEAFQ